MDHTAKPHAAHAAVTTNLPFATSLPSNSLPHHPKNKCCRSCVTLYQNEWAAHYNTRQNLAESQGCNMHLIETNATLQEELDEALNRVEDLQRVRDLLSWNSWASTKLLPGNACHGSALSIGAIFTALAESRH